MSGHKDQPLGTFSTFDEHAESSMGAEHSEGRAGSVLTSRRGSTPAAERACRSLNAKLANSLAPDLAIRLFGNGVTNLPKKYRIGGAEDIRAFELGAILAEDPTRYDNVEGIDEASLLVILTRTIGEVT